MGLIGGMFSGIGESFRAEVSAWASVELRLGQEGAAVVADVEAGRELLTVRECVLVDVLFPMVGVRVESSGIAERVACSVWR